MNKALFILSSVLITLAFNIAYSQEREVPADIYKLKKGVSNIGFRVGLSQKDVENDWLLTAVKLKEIKNKKFDMSVSGAWFFDDYTSVSAKASYTFLDTRNTIEAKILDMVLDASEYSSNVASTAISFGAGVKNYVPMGKSSRIYFFSETNVSYKYIASLTRDIYDDGRDIKKVMKNTHEVSLGLSPGLMFFITKGFSFEFSFNPVVIYFNKSFITEDEVSKGKTSDVGIDLKLNPFNIYFGFAYYFGMNK